MAAEEDPDVQPAAAPDQRFHVVPQPRAHHWVIDQILYGIRSGLLTPGEQLPTIEALAASTGVSRPVVGDAIRVLREHGVVATKRGVHGGVTILQDHVPPALLRVATEWRDATLTELVEVRRPIEEELAVLAGLRGSSDDFAAMRESITLLEHKFDNRDDGAFLRYDHRFHYQIGRAAHSEMLAYYQHRVLCQTAAALYGYDLFHEVPELVINTHEAMLRAMEKRDIDAIRAAADFHWRTSSGAFAGVEDIDLTRPTSAVPGPTAAT